jgi:hypothetical protein
MSWHGTPRLYDRSRAARRRREMVGLSIVFALLPAPSAAAGWDQVDLNEVAFTPSSVFAADLDGDGDPDTLTASETSGKVMWLENLGGGRRGGLRSIDADVPGAVWAVAADLDQDGDPDVLVAANEGGAIAWYENVSAVFGSGRTIDSGASGARCVIAADLDGDADLDVVSAAYDSATIAWYENLGGAFGPRKTLSAEAQGATSVFAADLDGDGDEDVVALFEEQIVWFQNLGAGLFAAAATITEDAFGAANVFAADLDGDGDSDVVAGGPPLDWYVSSIVWFESRPEGFEQRWVGSAEAEHHAWVYAAELDGDAGPDIVATFDSDGTTSWYGNQMRGGAPPKLGFDGETRLDGYGPGNGPTVVTDLDVDGWNDILTVDSRGDNIAWYRNEPASEDGFDPARMLLDHTTGIVRVVVSDTDGDGDGDVVVASDDGKVALFENTADGFSDQRSVASLWLPGDLDVADLDGDGDPDLVASSMAGWGESRLLWYENLGGRFGKGTWIADGEHGSVRCADMDQDGDIDIVTSKMAWFENLGGTFREAWSHHGAGPVKAVQPADLDGDGDDDLLASVHDGAQVVWFENHDGALTMVGAIAAGSFEDALHTADFDGDGDVDLLLMDSAKSELSWYQNDGGSFTGWSIAPDTDPGAHAADLDGDGDIDVSAATGGSLSWYENLGGAFVKRGAISEHNAGPHAAADLDGDGLADVVGGNDHLAWYRNPLDGDGDGYSVAAGDCDDLDPNAYPGAAEVVDGIDQDCDGVPDNGTEAYDDDGDGFSELDGDCDDADPGVSPVALEVEGNGVDDDCDGLVDEHDPDSPSDADSSSDAPTRPASARRPSGCGCAQSQSGPIPWFLLLLCAGAVRSGRHGTRRRHAKTATS